MAETVLGRFAVHGVSAATPVARAAAAILVDKAAPIFELAGAAASGTDADAVHDMRVASRRTREALALFEPYYPAKAFARWSDTVRCVTKTLGRVRDTDVMLAEFSSLAWRAESVEERVTLAWIIGDIQGRRAAKVRKMRRRIGELDLAGERKAFARFAEGVRRVPDAREPLECLAETEIGARVTALYAHVPAALQPDNPLVQHAMRIDAKKLRYCVETFAPSFGPGLDGVYPVLKDLQDQLGELHDRDVFAGALRETTMDSDPAPAGVTAEGVQAVLDDLARERQGFFDAFAAIIDQWPEPRMRAALLGALDKIPPVVEVPGS